jgi:uncharacterized protein YdhG (YjbR/CyaY superfamily)
MFVATKPHTIDEYLAGLSPESRTALQKVRRAVHAAAPEAEECISCGMPAFHLNGKFIAGFKAAANHCSFHPMSGDSVATLKADLAGDDTSRGTIRFSATCWPAGHTRSQAGEGENCRGMNCRASRRSSGRAS